MFQSRTKFELFVNLDPTPGAFHTRENARDNLQALLTQAIPHYSPSVYTTSEDLEPGTRTVTLTDDDAHWLAVALENAKDRAGMMMDKDEDYETQMDGGLLVQKYTRLQGIFPAPDITLPEAPPSD